MGKKSIIALFLSVLALAGCGSSVGSSGGSSGDNVFVVTTDHSTGSFATVNGATRNANSNLGTIHSDAIAKYYNGLVYVINRLGADNIQVLDPNNGYSTKLQFSTGSGSNPQDIAFASATKAYVTRYDSTDVWIVNPSTGEHTGSISLASYADADGTPEAGAVYVKNNKLFIAVQNLNKNSYWTTTGKSKIVIVDISADTVTAEISLPYQDPSGYFIELPNGKLAISCVGDYGVNDGGIAVVDPSTNDISKLGATESVLGGDITYAVMSSDTEGFAIISDASFNTSVVKFNATTGLVSTIYTTAGYKLYSLAVDGNELWVTDRTSSNPGIRIFSVSSGAQITTSPISVGLPPSMILFM